MMLDEFNDLVRDRGCAVCSYSEFQLINFIYTWHPCIKGKDTIVDLWLLGGIKLMEELKPRAEQALEKSTEIRRLQGEIQRLQEKINRLE